MPSIAEKTKSLRFVPGTTNAPAIKDTIRVAFMEELKFGDALPSPVAGKHLISADIEFRAAVAANQSATPPQEAIPAGGCVEFEITRKKNSYKANGKHEDGYTHYEPTLEVYMPLTDEEKAYQLKQYNGAKVFVEFRDTNGRRRVGVSVEMAVDLTIDDNSNVYKITFMFPVMGQEPFLYSGALVIRA